MIILSIEANALKAKNIHVTQVTLTGALLGNRYGGHTSIKAIDECGISDGLFIAGNEYGATHVIRADHFSEAHETLMDNMTSCTREELASNLDLDNSDESLDAWWADGDSELPDFHYYQANFNGETGIVDVGHYFWMDSVDVYNEGRDESEQVTPLFYVSDEDYADAQAELAEARAEARAEALADLDARLTA